MKIFRAAAILCLFLISSCVFGQEMNEQYVKGKNDTIRVAVTMVDGELIPWLPMPEVSIYGRRYFKTPDERLKFNRLQYNVTKVYPYAVIARNRYAQLQKDLALTGDRREQKKLVKICEQQIKEMFNKEIKNMTITQGEILIKLIDRETGNSSYELVRQLKSGVTAFAYQTVARVFGHDLKEKYNPQQERDIEAIVLSLQYRYN